MRRAILSDQPDGHYISLHNLIGPLTPSVVLSLPIEVNADENHATHRVILSLLFGGTAFAWNGKGHEVVAYIAYQHLDPTTKTKVDALLQ